MVTFFTKLIKDESGVTAIEYGLIAALIGAHLYLVTKLGTTAPPWGKAEEATELRERNA